MCGPFLLEHLKMTQPLNWYTLDQTMADIGTASTVRFVVPTNGYLRRVDSTIAAALTGADAVLTVAHNNTNLTPTITVTQSGSAEGDYDYAEFYRPVKRGDWIEVTTDGGPTNAVVAAINCVLSQ